MPSAPVAFPGPASSVSNNAVTVDNMINNPTTITRDIAQLADKKFFASKVFSNVGGVEGGAVLYELPPTTATDLFGERAFQEVAPGQEFPEQTFLRGVPTIAKPRKIGSKFYVTKEARKRNQTRIVANAINQQANTLALTLDAMAVAVLAASITANSRTQAGQSWATAAGVTINNSSGTNMAFTDLLLARKVVDLEERGRSLNAALIHPNQELSLAEAATLRGISIDQIFAAAGIREWYSSPRVTAGTAILYDADSPPGGWANEFPLEQETEWEGPAAGGRQRWVYQWSISPAMFVDDPYGLLQLTGIA
jgi:hypothetical protein